MEKENQIKSIFVANIPYDIDLDDFKSLFTKFGAVKRFDFPDFRSRRGICFVHFENPEDAAKCLESLNGFLYYGKVLSVKFSDKDRKESNQTKSHRQNDSERDSNSHRYRDRQKPFQDDYNSRNRHRDMRNSRDRNRDYSDRQYQANRDDYYPYQYPQNRSSQQIPQAFAIQAAPSILPAAMQMSAVMAAPVQVLTPQHAMQMMRIVQSPQALQVRQYQDHSGNPRNIQPILTAIPQSQFIQSRQMYSVDDQDDYYDNYRGDRRQKGNNQDKGSKYRQQYH